MHDLQAKQLAIEVMQRHSPVYFARQLGWETDALRRHLRGCLAEEIPIDVVLLTRWLLHVTSLAKTLTDQMLHRFPGESEHYGAEAAGLRHAASRLSGVFRLFLRVVHCLGQTEPWTVQRAMDVGRNALDDMRACRDRVDQRWLAFLRQNMDVIASLEQPPHWKGEVWRSRWNKAAVEQGPVSFSPGSAHMPLARV